MENIIKNRNVESEKFMILFFIKKNKNAKILIVEDEEHINRLIELVLISDGYYRIKKLLTDRKQENYYRIQT